MKTLAQRILDAVVAEAGLTDRELTDRLLGKQAPQQAVNQAARGLASFGLLARRKRPDGRIGNYPGTMPVPRAEAPSVRVRPKDEDFISEDDVKQTLTTWLERAGWRARVILGRGHGIDVEARRGNERWIIEAKGQGTLNPMRVNFFLGVLGELLQRMDDPKARYSLAVPDLPQYRGLWQPLPRLAKERTRISALFVTDSGSVEEVP